MPTSCAARWAPSAASSGSSRCSEKLYEGMATNGLVGQAADDIYAQDPGVRELRLRRVALAVVRAARLRELVDQAALSRGVPRRAAARPADGLLLARDPHRRRPPARRRGAPPRPAALGRRGDARAGRAIRTALEPERAQPRRRARRPGRRARRATRDQRPAPPASTPAPTASSRRSATSTSTPPTSPPRTAATARFAVRLGLAAVTGIGATVAERIVAERESARPVPRPARPRAPHRCHAAQLEALATAGAFECLGLSRREAIWLAGSAAQDRAEFLPDSLDRPCSRRCSPTRRATSGSPPTCGRRASPPTTTR